MTNSIEKASRYPSLEIYVSPDSEVVEIQAKNTILTGSGEDWEEYED